MFLNRLENIERFLANKMLPGGAVHRAFPQEPFCWSLFFGASTFLNRLEKIERFFATHMLLGGAAHVAFLQEPFCWSLLGGVHVFEPFGEN